MSAGCRTGRSGPHHRTGEVVPTFFAPCCAIERLASRSGSRAVGADLSRNPSPKSQPPGFRPRWYPRNWRGGLSTCKIASKIRSRCGSVERHGLWPARRMPRSFCRASTGPNVARITATPAKPASRSWRARARCRMHAQPFCAPHANPESWWSDGDERTGHVWIFGSHQDRQ